MTEKLALKYAGDDTMITSQAILLALSPYDYIPGYSSRSISIRLHRRLFFSLYLHTITSQALLLAPSPFVE